MLVRDTAFHSRRTFHAALLTGVSALSLLAAGSPAQARNILAMGGGVTAVNNAAVGAMAGAQQAAVASQQSMNALSRATQAIQSMQAAQSAARNLAVSASAAVPNGLTPGGLVPFLGAGTDPALQAQGIVWQNAQLPTQTTDGAGNVDVTVRQTASKAILTWQNFNIGKNTTLDFDQRGNSGWTVLNRVLAGTPDPITGARVQAAPSQILGHINAPGQVYVINQNGIIFGGSAQVNVHTLVASSLDIGLPTSNVSERNTYFLNADSSELTFSQQYLIDRTAAGFDGVKVLPQPQTPGTEPVYALAADVQEGDVQVQAGAVITSPALGAGNESLGGVVLAAPNVVNQGTIQVPDGQAILVAARHFTLDSNDLNLLKQNSVDPALYDPNLRGSVVRTGLDDLPDLKFLFGNNIPNTFSVIAVVDGAQANIVAPKGDPMGWGGQVTAGGLISAERGNITLTGNMVQVDGALSSTTSVSQNGSIDIFAKANQYAQAFSLTVNGDSFLSYSPEALAGSVTLSPSATLTILADTQIQSDGTIKTLPSDAQSSAQFRNSVITIKSQDGIIQKTPPDRITNQASLQLYNTPGQIVIQGGALIKAPSANLTFSAGDPIADNAGIPSSSYVLPAMETPGLVIESGATLDVSGLMDVELPMSSNLITVSRVGLNELADDPLQRASYLYRQPIYLDRRLHGTNPDGSTWEGTPLINANGYVDAYGRTVSELLQPGGTIQINGASVIGSGATLNVSGGYIHYQAGYLPTTRVVDASGHIYDIGLANPNVPIVGLAGAFAVDHPHWGITETYSSGLVGSTGGDYQAAYDQGANAGALTVTGPSILDGSILAAVTVGTYQHSGVGPYSSNEPEGGTLSLTPAAGVNVLLWPIFDLTLAKTAPDVLPADYMPGEALPTALFEDVTLSTDALNASGLATIKLTAADKVTVTPDAALTLPNGGSLSLTSQTVDIAGKVTAHSGAIAINLTPDAPFYFSGLTSTAQPPQVAFTLEAGAALDLSGLWINDNGVADAQGTSFVNGGSISIADKPTIFNTDSQTFVPDVADVALAAASLIDLSGGGHVATNGKLSVDSTGVPLGRGGNLSIVLHGTGAGSPGFIPTSPDNAGLPAVMRQGVLDDTIQIAATIRDLSFQGGGSFTLVVPEIRIMDGGTLGGVAGDITVPIDFLENAGFSSYALAGDFTAGIDSGSVIRLSQRQLIPTADAPDAQSLAGATIVGERPGDQRRPVNFSLTGLGWTGGSSLDFISSGYHGSLALNNALIADNVQIVADPGASIAFSAVGQLTFSGQIVAPGGSVSFSERHLSLTTLDVSPNATLLLRPGSVIDVSGAFVADPDGSGVVRGQQIQAGSVLPGGTVSFNADMLAIPAGVTVNVSGGTGIVDLLSGAAAPLGAQSYSAATIGSDAGVVSIAAIGAQDVSGSGGTVPFGYGAFEGAILAAGGTPTNAGGNVSVSAEAIVVTDGGSVLGADPQSEQALPSGLPNAFVLPAQILAGGGVDRLSLTATVSSLARTGVISFSGSPHLILGRELDLRAVGLNWLPGGTYDPAVALPSGAVQGDVSLSAPYLSITGTAGVVLTATAVAAPSALRLTLKGDTIDVTGQITAQDFTETNLISAGDIRADGSLVAGGDIGLTAAEIYPATGNIGLFRSTAPDGTITISGNGAPTPVPLSAGGTLIIDAANIEQGGVLRAPLGTIILGPAASYVPSQGTDVVTSKIDLLPGSLTSTSLDGLDVPYGETVAQTDWYFYGLASGGVAPAGSNVATPLTILPVQHVYINGAAITEAPGATLDLSGGGDVFATEFVPGLGGSRDVLRTSLTGNANATIYSIVPGAQPAVAPVDLDLTGGKTEAVHGQTITTEGNIPGLPAGTYTLYSGDYASLPGAFRVELRPGTTDFPAGNAIRMPDGSFTVAAVAGISGTGIQSSRTAAYSIMPNVVWRQYTQIANTSGNAHFTQLAATAGVVTPRLPADAGQMTLGATTALTLQGTNLFQAGPGGRGGEADITGLSIEIASAGITGQDGYLVLRPEDLRNLNVDSLLIGGTRTATSMGNQLTATAQSLLIDTTAQDPLTGSELILAVATIGGTPGLLTIAPNSVVAAVGTSTGEATPIVAGSASFIRLSNAGLVQVTRASTAPTQDRIVVGAGAVLNGGASLLLATPGDAAIDNSAILAATAIDIGGSHINIDAPDGVTGTNIGLGTLAQFALAKEVILRGSQAITFYAPVSMGTADADLTLDTPVLAASGFNTGAVQIVADIFTVTNDLGAAPGVTPTAGTGTLAVTANRIAVTGTDKVITGFGSLSLTAGGEILLGAGGPAKGGLQDVPVGSLTTTADLLFATPQLVLTDASDQTIATSGLFQLRGIPGVAFADTDQLGGRLDVDAGVIDIDGTILARSGTLNLRARTGDLMIGADTRILAGGHEQAFVDTVIDVGAGAVTLAADQGNVVLASGGLIDLSGVGRGDAGSLAITLGGTAGTLSLNGTVNAVGGTAGAASSMFAVNSQGILTLDDIAHFAMVSGFQNQVAVTSGRGDLSLSGAVTAHEVDVDAEGGQVTVAGTIDGSGSAGGVISLYGADGVTLASTARLLARASDATAHAGLVEIGTSGDGLLNLAAGSVIDVTGGAGNYAQMGGGTIHFRAPFATFGANIFQSSLIGPTVVVFEPFQTVDVSQTNGAVIDQPTWAGIAAGFTPDTTGFEGWVAGLYPQLAAQGVLHVQPGLELDNFDPTVNDGGITFQDLNQFDPVTFAPTPLAIDFSSLRYGAAADEPGWLTVRAAGDITLDATFSDGFLPNNGTSFFPGSGLATDGGAPLMGWSGTGPLPLSWSYRFTSGAASVSANPTAVAQAVTFQTAGLLPDQTAGALAGQGSLLIGDTLYAFPFNYADPAVLIRTGTGSIDLNAGGSISLLNVFAEVYTAGVNTPNPADFANGQKYDFLSEFGAFGQGSDATLAIPTGSGDVTVRAQGDFNQPGVVSTDQGLTGYDQMWSSSVTGNSNIPWVGFDGSSSSDPSVYGMFGADPSTFGAATGQSAEFVDFAALSNAGNIYSFGTVMPPTGTGISTIGGGSISLRAGGDINDAFLYVVSPFRVTGGLTPGAPVTMTRYGNGNLIVAAGGNIAGGVAYVDSGVAKISAGNAVTITAVEPSGAFLGLALGLGDASALVTARDGITISNIFQAATRSDQLAQASSPMSLYGVDDSLNMVTASGDMIAGGGYAPPTVALAAPRGTIQIVGNWILAPSPTGTLGLLAEDAVQFEGTIDMLDISPDLLGTPLHPSSQALSAEGAAQLYHFTSLLVSGAGDGDYPSAASDGANNYELHAGPTPLHAGYQAPAYIVALNGDIDVGAGNPNDPVQLAYSQDTFFSPGTLDVGRSSLILPKEAIIWAGKDIYGLTYIGQNVSTLDTTLIHAGRDIADTPGAFYSTFGAPFMAGKAESSFIIGGPGQFDLIAGRSISLSPSVALNNGLSVTPQGIQAVGNLIDPWLPPSSAQVNILYGVGPGLDEGDFASHYLDPANAAGLPANYAGDLVAYMDGRNKSQDMAAHGMALSTDLSPDQAYAAFLALSPNDQLPLIEQVFFSELRSIVPNADSVVVSDAGRAYTAINTLFPTADGYTNQLAKSPQRQDISNFRMLNSVLRTEFGSSINIMAPGGDALLGSLTLDPTLPLNDQGIFTARGGAINVFLDGNFTVNNSRVFTEQGGDETIFSANGNIDAGRGKKTAAYNPPLNVLYDGGLIASVNPSGSATGSGIATLITVPGSPRGDIYLLAPRGDVDAGDAGIRSSGNVSILALQVLNADNIQAAGTVTGVPTTAAPNIGDLTAASNTAGAAIAEATDNARRSRQPATSGDLPSIITVEVIGYGGGDSDSDHSQDPREDQRRKKDQQSLNSRPAGPEYNNNSAVQIAGYGTLSEAEAQLLTADERRRLEQR